MPLVANMFVVNKGMAHWTNNQEILFFVVISISILVVHSQNLLNRIISAFLTAFNQASDKHRFPDSRVFWSKKFLFTFIYTTLATKFSISGKAISEFFFAIRTCVYCLSLSYSRFVIAFTRTIFSFITSRRNVSENIPANRAGTYYDPPLIKSFT